MAASWGDDAVDKVIVTQTQEPMLQVPSSHIKSQMDFCNPSTVETMTGGSLELTGKLILPDL